MDQSHNLSPLPGPGQPIDQIVFPLHPAITRTFVAAASHACSEEEFHTIRETDDNELSRRVLLCSPDITFGPHGHLKRNPLNPASRSGTLGQQLTYIIVLKATYSNTWVDLAKVYNALWNYVDFVSVESAEGIQQRYKILGSRPYPEISKDAFRDMWRHQTLYPRDPDSMKAELQNPKGRNDFQLRVPDYDGVIVAQAVDFGEFMREIDRAGRELGVVLKKLEEEGEAGGSQDLQS
ncbi:hypothetical protein OEA41_007460 [Lepraria neglecta]|uniref:Uncharacterized protein n=1 Tax=Lepraria neglecta TaxID=209136 RepID=A0AAD9ZDQ4_9LECA|nr:hypothetical protein OEA41_007460 [Lepraria neglecta]